jgi:hypothetical protein
VKGRPISDRLLMRVGKRPSIRQLYWRTRTATAILRGRNDYMILVLCPKTHNIMTASQIEHPSVPIFADALCYLGDRLYNHMEEGLTQDEAIRAQQN